MNKPMFWRKIEYRVQGLGCTPLPKTLGEAFLRDAPQRIDTAIYLAIY